MVYEKDGKVIVTQLRSMSEIPESYTVFAWYTRDNNVSYFIDIFKTIFEGETVYFSEQELDIISLEQLSGWIDLHYDNSSLHDL